MLGICLKYITERSAWSRKSGDPNSKISLQKSSLKQQVSEREGAAPPCGSSLGGSPERGCYLGGRRNPGESRNALLGQPRFHWVLLPPCGQCGELRKGFSGEGRWGREGKERGEGRQMSWDTQLQSKDAIYHPGVLSTADQTSGFGKRLEDTMPLSLHRQPVTVLSPPALCVCVYK